MAYEVIECSPLARARIETQTDVFGTEPPSPHHRTKYPYALLKIGQCFTVSYDEANENSLRGGAANYGKKSGGKKFTVIKHAERRLIEVARIY